MASKNKLVVTYTAQKKRGETRLTVMSEHSLESLSNDEGDVNENG